jgi:CheY-like chemotaxis protein
VTEQRTNELREAELEEALRRSQRLETVGHLAGGVAHDFNNLLAAILASAELLTDDVPEGRPRAYAEEIQRSAMRGAALVRQLLTFAQRDHAEPRVVDLNKVISGMEPLLRRSLGEDVHLQITTAESSADVLADPTHLEQVVLNLAVNARDAMPSGGVLWIATAIDPDDDAPENDRIVLSVTDTGTGIAPEVRQRMFEPFVTSKEPGKGTGLGLSTVQNIVHSMHGHLEVHSKIGEGTTFEISFARRFDNGDDAVGARDADGRLFDGAGRRILLVEDDRSVRAVLSHTLETNGFVVTAVNRATDALQAVEQRDFDIVLTDAVMPGMSGPDLIEHLRTAHPHLSVVLMSGYAHEVFDESRLGAQLLLRKPFTTPELLAVLRKASRPDVTL